MSGDPSTPASRARKLRYHHRVHDSLLPRARNLWQKWTVEEINVALDPTAKAKDIAAKLGRTTGGVQKVRRVYGKKPVTP